MRQTGLIALCLSGTVALTACGGGSDAEVNRALKDVNVIDESNLNDIMLTVGDPNEAVAYFQKTAAANPERVDLKRGLAKSLVRAKKPKEAAAVWAQVAATPEGTNDDRVEMADALIRANDWTAMR